MNRPFASATNSSTLSVSARRVRVDPDLGEQRLAAQRFDALAQHLAALAEGRLGDASEHAHIGRQRRRARDEMDDRRRDLGRRRKGLRRHVEGDPRLGAPARRARRAGHRRRCRVPRRCAARPRAGTSASATGRRAASSATVSQRISNSRADIVGQVGDDLHRPAGGERGEIGLQRIAGNDLQAAGIVLGDLGKGRQAALVPLDRNHFSAPLASRARVRPPGPGPTSMTVTPSRLPAARAILPVRLRSSRKFWPSDFLAASPWRWMTSRSGGRPSRRHAAASSAAGQPRRKLQRGDQAVGARHAFAGDVERRAVVRRGADEGQAERDVDASSKPSALAGISAWS